MVTNKHKNRRVRISCSYAYMGYAEVGLFTALQMLEFWLEGKLELKREDFESITDALHDWLEDLYDERHRLSID